MLTYRQLLNQLQALSSKQLDDTVTLYDLQDDEYFGATSWFITGKDADVLDPNHFVLRFKEGDE